MEVVERTEPPVSHEAPLLVQAAPGLPVFRGIGSGRDHICGRCSSVLLENLTDESVFDLRIECAACGQIFAVPSAPPGRGLGGILRVVSRGHRFVGTFALDMDEVVVGERATWRRQRETGQRPNETTPAGMLDISGIERVVEEARCTFEPILAVAAPASRRRSTAKHRLVRLIEAVETNLQTLRSGSREVNVRSIITLQRATNAFRSWQFDPSWPRLIDESKQSETFEHNAVVLQVASVFAEAGLGAELVPPGPDRTADLLLRVSATHSVEVDVKTPQALQLPGAGVLFRLLPARKTLKAALRRSRGQFGTSGILVVAGEAWPNGIDSYATAADEILGAPLPASAGERARQHYERLLGLLLVSTGFEELSERSFRARLFLRWIASPRYTGPLDLQLARDFDGPFSLRIGDTRKDSADRGREAPDHAGERFAGDGAFDPARFRLNEDGEVEVEGAISNIGTAYTNERLVVTKLGERYRPPQDRDFDVACDGGFTVVTVSRDGRLLADPTLAWISLHGIRYAAARAAGE